jgi:hypothetical protein
VPGADSVKERIRLALLVLAAQVALVSSAPAGERTRPADDAPPSPAPESTTLAPAAAESSQLRGEDHPATKLEETAAAPQGTAAAPGRTKAKRAKTKKRKRSGTKAKRTKAKRPKTKAAKRKAARREAAKRRATERRQGSFGTAYHLTALGGYYVQGERAGAKLDTGVLRSFHRMGHRFHFSGNYLLDPFATKTFNFAKEYQHVTSDRLVQQVHKLRASTEWRTKWSRDWRSAVEFQGDSWWPARLQDRRFSFQPSAWIRWGRLRGPFAKFAAAAYYKEFPNYYLSDRTLNRVGTENSVTLGYRFRKWLELSGGYGVEYRDYLDARYNTIDANGIVVRATESKFYLKHAPFLRAEIEPTKRTQLIVRYGAEYNDSTDYNRRVTGRNQVGTLQDKYIPDYYDYLRHRITLVPSAHPFLRLRISGLVELWDRQFMNYEARTAQNLWTGATRHDTSLELGCTVQFRLLKFRASGLSHALYVVATGSHLSRQSNMQRELSLATNYDVTRGFLGLELSEL